MQADLRIQPLAPTFGAEILGLHPGHLAEAWPRLRDAFVTHRLLVLRELALDEAQFTQLAGCFGSLEARYVMRRSDGKPSSPVHLIQNLDASGQVVPNPYGNANYFWHTDKQYHLRPALATVLQALELPPAGGSTEFADMTAAYEALPPPLQKQLLGVQAVYSYSHMLRTCLEREPTPEELALTPPVQHPLVRTHPDSGRRSLYLGMYCSALAGWPAQEGAALIRRLHEHATDRRFAYAHSWRAGDVLVWDNRCLLHRAVADFDMARHRRVLRRAVVQGEVPA